MGRVIQIRVSASTFDCAEVERRWPELFKLAFEGSGPAWPSKGALELAAALVDRLGLGLLPAGASGALGPGIRKLDDARRRLDAALGDWQPAKAEVASSELEDTLDELEKSAKKL